jgi:hypothetical protein
MYIILREGCKQPSVTALQILLNRTREKDKLRVDGDFGPKTRAAVIDFQRKMNLAPDGIVGMNTWPRLVQKSGLKIVDAVDITDLATMNRTAIPDLTVAGGDPILAGAMCGGVAHVVSRIRSQVGQSGATVILRFIGHGAPGGQYITGGRWLYLEGKDGKPHKVDDAGAYSNAIYLLKKRENISKVEADLARLRDIFVRFGSVEMHACMIAQGTGMQLLKRLASIFGVPVAGGLRTQKVGGNLTFAFEGPVVTAVPFGGDLQGWSSMVARSE